MWFCPFCQKSCKSLLARSSHIGVCESNPKREEIRLKRGAKTRESNLGKKSTEESRKKVSETIKRKVKEGSWHVSLARKHHYEYKGVDLHGTWELEYAKHLDANGIKWERCKKRFPYLFEGTERRYTPDFYLPDSDEYVEIKGYKTLKDEAKWSQFKGNLRVLMEDDLKALGLKI